MHDQKNRVIRLVSKARDEVLLSRVEIASSFWARFKGLMGRKSLDEGHGLYLNRCNSIHCFFMRFPIDVVFLGEKDEVVGAYPSKSPWSMIMPVKGARSCIEATAGSLAHKVSKGEILSLEEAIK